MDIAEELKIADRQLTKKLQKIAKDQIEYWDIRIGIKNGTNLDFTDQKSREISSYDIIECGIRTFINGGWGFNVLKNPNKNTLISGFLKAIKLAKLSESLCKNKFKITERDPLIKNFKITCKKRLEDIGIDEKIQVIKSHEKIALDYSPKIKNTHTLYLDGHSQNLILSSFGHHIIQDLSFLRLFSLIHAQEKGILQRSINSIGGIGGFEIIETEEANNLSEKTAKEAVNLLKAKSPVGGKFTVIMDPKLTGTFIHEAFGHACEADLVLNKESILEGKIGLKIAKANIEIIDDPTMNQGKKFNLPYELFGSYFIDDEGTPSQKTTIIENGILRNYLHSLETSSRMAVPSNGHGRANSCSSRPQVRMGFTYLVPKDWKYEEIIEDTKHGVLCEDFQYGYTDPTTGNFQFKCKLSYKIEDGEKRELMRDVSLSGLTLEVLNNVTAIGKTMSYSDGICGKGGQTIRACDGGPYIRTEEITLGGLN